MFVDSSRSVFSLPVPLVVSKSSILHILLSFSQFCYSPQLYTPLNLFPSLYSLRAFLYYYCLPVLAFGPLSLSITLRPQAPLSFVYYSLPRICLSLFVSIDIPCLFCIVLPLDTVSHLSFLIGVMLSLPFFGILVVHFLTRVISLSPLCRFSK